MDMNERRMVLRHAWTQRDTLTPDEVEEIRSECFYEFGPDWQMKILEPRP